MSNGERVVRLPAPKIEIDHDDKARRIGKRADQVAAQPEGFWQVILGDAAGQLGIPVADFEAIVVAKRQTLKKKIDDEKAANRYTERRTEEKRVAEKEKQQQVDDEDRRKQKLKDEGLQNLAKLTGAEREAGLVELAGHLGVEPGVLHRELDDYIAGDLEFGPQKEKEVDTLVRLGRGRAVFFCNFAGQAFADVLINKIRNTWPLLSANFTDWLIHQFYLEKEKAPATTAVKNAVRTLAAYARFECSRHEVHLRFAEADAKIYIDLGDANWRCVEIASSGWRIINDPPVSFWRTANMRPLPVPERGGRIAQLRPFVNLGDSAFTLFVSVLLNALRPGCPQIIPYLEGEAGSTKSWLTEVLRTLTDPNKAPVRSLPTTEENLWVAAYNAPVLAFNNISRISKAISDALCQLASGEGFGRRARYTDSSEFVVEGSRMIVLNGIKNAVTEPDLADRTIAFKPVRLSHFRSMVKVRQEFKAECPVIFGALLDAVVHGLQELPNVGEVRPSSRVPDFLEWGVACEGVYAEPGAFLAAYDAGAAEATETASLGQGRLSTAVFFLKLPSHVAERHRRAGWVLLCHRNTVPASARFGF